MVDTRAHFNKLGGVRSSKYIFIEFEVKVSRAINFINNRMVSHTVHCNGKKAYHFCVLV